MSQNVTMDGSAIVSEQTQRVTVTYASVLTAMSVTYQYTDSSGSTHSLTADVHVVGELRVITLVSKSFHFTNLPNENWK